jgi:hypothetical protein
MVELIRTGTAAEILGTSRQHVVDLVDRGILRNFGTNVHRRLDVAAVRALVQSDGTRDDRQSLWLHAAVAGKVARSPEAAVHRARLNLARMERANRGPSRWLRHWHQVLDDGPERVIRTLTADTQEGRELRQNSPFAGVLTERERLEALAAFRANDRSRP